MLARSIPFAGMWPVDPPEAAVSDTEERPTFRLLVVPGVVIDRWARTWSERLPDVDLALVPVEAAEAAGQLAQADAGLVRLPVDQDTCHAIPLYTEATVVVFPIEHLLAAADEVTLADLADETLTQPLDDVLAWTGTSGVAVTADRPGTTAEAVELVAASVGVLVVPQSLARAYHRRDLTYRVLTDAPTSSVGLAWRRDQDNPLVEEMIGIVRGRTANSTRGRGPAPADPPTRAEGGARRTPPKSGQAGPRRGGQTPGKRRSR
ncbi:LysR family substrate-binding domain-containing protein [Catellatospora sp. KI3]|uniref:LysR family substrate-binding domain-containing protein n=1 Tax=Catellatospora sp. KI3 TaxID=3041620 RepID=UPI002482BC03|nr:LysR family substrate-binding domain-containing protein [Catellatospora sp. KI3]MDI1461323.1 LysR family substrate-binding domain-containing protein [Catellatospora sp. KI3]